MMSMELIKTIHADRERKLDAWRRQHVAGPHGRHARINKPRSER
jgi:hypothetical protein